MKTSKTPLQLENIQINAMTLMGGQAYNQQIQGIIPEENRDSKAFLNFKKFLSKTVLKPLEKINEQIEELRLDHALEVDGKLARNAQGGYEYSRAGERAFNEAAKALRITPVDVDYDRENESWESIVDLLPKEMRSKWSLELNEDLKEALADFYSEGSDMRLP